MKKRLFIGTGILLIIAIVAFYSLKGSNKESKYETIEVDRGDIVEKITATGAINPVITVRVGSQVSGRITMIYADFNSQVKKGQAIAQLETDIYQAKVTQADANFNLAKAQTREARVLLLDAENNLRRIKNLTKGLVASERDLEVAETNYEAAKAALSAAQARKEQSRALLNSTKVDLEYTTIYSPVDGIVISRNCDVGQTVVSTFQTPDLFLIAQDLTKMQVEAYVDEADIGKIQAGQEVLFTVDAFPERTFSGKVSQVRFAPKQEQNVVTYATVIEVANPDLLLRPGMTATVSIIANEKKNVLRLPSIALRFKANPADKYLYHYDEEKDKDSGDEEELLNLPQSLWIINDIGQVKRIPIKAGISDGRYTEVLNGSIDEGEKVIVGYLSQWKQGVASGKSGFRFGFRR
ncbi:MAG: efflux RND transporter periplasmic adaptor subunit [Deltaproteobacteria bacterium]|nr:efflux RND transporter periplasmic adaptor subunit [Deltaproteobacteria bacterium]